MGRPDLQCLFVDTDVLEEADDVLLEHALDAAPGWRSSANGAWGVFDPNSPEERVQTTALKERHAAAAATVQPTRVVSRIVHLLRDPAYAKVRLGVKLQQLAPVRRELEHIDDRRALPRTVAYLSARRAMNPRSIDGGGCTLAEDDFSKGVLALLAGEEGCAACEACVEGEAEAGANAFVLRRVNP